MNDGAIVFSASVINIFTDGLVTVLPMPLIWSLKLPIRQRIAVISIFALGAFVNVAGTCRTVYVWKSQIASYDQTWEGWPVLLSAGVEITLGLVSLHPIFLEPSIHISSLGTNTSSQICSSAPALRPLITSFLPHLLSSKRNSSYPYSRRSQSNKFWSSTSRSRNSKMPATVRSNQKGYESDQYGILCTVEMGWSQSKAGDHHETLGTENRVDSPSNMELHEMPRQLPVTSKKPSDSALRETASPLNDNR